MDLLYRLFYTAFSLAAVAAATAPLVFILRVVLRGAPKKYSVYLWLLFFFRSVCPVSMSSPLCLISSLNRSFHLLLSHIGIKISNVDGVMSSWIDVFLNEISVNASFAACSFIWLAGMAALSVFTFIRERNIVRRLADANLLYENLYQADGIAGPVTVGVFFPKTYIPKDMGAADLKYLMRHFNAHVKRRDALLRFFAFFALVLQWFNPVMWAAYYLFIYDVELAADEASFKPDGSDGAMEYAQALYNVKCETGGGRPSPLTFNEKFIRERTSRLIYFKSAKRGRWGLAASALLLCFFWMFLLRPAQMIWNGGAWSISEKSAHADGRLKSSKGGLFKDSKEKVVASVSAPSPDGLEKIVSLVMTSGEYKKGKGYTGDFAVRLSDGRGASLYTADLDYVFNDVKKGGLHFDEGAKLYLSDYNDDGVSEISLGQRAAAEDERFLEIMRYLGINSSKKDKKKAKAGKKDADVSKTIYEYHLFNIGEASLTEISDEIYSTEGEEYASRLFEVPEKTTRVFISRFLGRDVYYAWDAKEEKYVRKDLDGRQLATYRTDYAGSEDVGKKESHVLKRDGRQVMEVKTVTDETGSEAIREIIINSNGSSKKMREIDGYLCDLIWAPALNGESERYAALIYNGTKAQTFTIYDLDRKKIYFENENGSSRLNGVFRKYNGNSVSFSEESPIVYTLMEMDGDRIKAGFAVNTTDGFAINGTYIYNVKTKEFSELSYAQNAVEGGEGR